MMIKLLIADVDGTLLTRDKVLTERTRDAVERLRAAGVKFTVTSGRPPRGLAKLVAALNITAPMAAFNGGAYVAPDLTTMLAQRTLAPDVAARVVDHLLQAGLDVWVYRGADWYLRDRNAYRVAHEMSNVGFEPTVIDDLHSVLDSAIKIVGASEDRSLVARCEAELGARFGAQASANRSTPFYLDVTHPEANKGMVVLQAARILGISVQEIATIGDMPNDIRMLSIAGLGVAMGNGSDEVKRAARHVTVSNDEEGFANAVDTFILGQPPLASTPLGLPPRTRACLFEVDGVLVQVAKLEAQAYKQMFDEYLREHARTTNEPFLPFDEVRDYVTHLDGRPRAEGIRSFLAAREIELSDATVDRLIHRQEEILHELLRTEHAEIYEGSIGYLRAVRDAGLRMAVVSSSKACADTLQAAGIADLFDARIDGVVAAERHLSDLPSPDTYLAAAEALGVTPEQTTVFGDAVAGVDAGRAGHFGYVIGVDRFGGGAELGSHGADVVVRDLGALLRHA